MSPLCAQEPAATAPAGENAPAPAAAGADIERSTELFREGRELLARGALEEACRKFEDSLALRRSPGTLLNIGYCRARGAELLAALDAYREALELAQSQPDREKAQLWSAAAQREIQALQGRVAQLSVRASQDGVAVRVDERPVNAAGEAIFLNPGEHHLRASAPGKQTLDLGIELSEGQRLTLTVPPLGDDGSLPPRAAEPAEPAGARAAAPAPRTASPPSDMSQGVSWRWPLLIGGGALFASGAVFGVVAARMVSRPDFDTPEESDRARGFALTADVLMGTGLAGIGLGIVWPWLDPDPTPGTPSSSDPLRSGLAGGCGRGRCALSVSGAF